MSNIYIQEPPTNGKVCLETTVGDIEIELWSKECPKACRNFVQHCTENYYDDSIFHRVVPGFIVQGGDPTGSGFGGESVYGSPFKDEFHSRLRFVRRGLVAMANGGKKDDNGSQFFFTLDKTPELQNKNAIFGQVVGNTLYNMLKLAECEIDKNERPEYPQKILKTKIISNPFPDITARVNQTTTTKDKAADDKRDTKATKNFNLLSFGDEAEEDEELNINLNKSLSAKGKSSLDYKSTTASTTVPTSSTVNDNDQKSEDDGIAPNKDARDKSDTSEMLDKVRAKLKANKESKESLKSQRRPPDNDDVDMHELLDDEKEQLQKSKLAAYKEEFKMLKKSLAPAKNDANEEEKPEENVINPDLQEFHNEVERYNDKKGMEKSATRAQEAYKKLEAFREKLHNARKTSSGDHHDANSGNEAASKLLLLSDDEEDLEESEWLAKRFVVSEEKAVVRDAVDVHVKNEERYELDDPRHPLNKRRRESKPKKEKDRHREKRAKVD